MKYFHVLKREACVFLAWCELNLSISFTLLKYTFATYTRREAFGEKKQLIFHEATTVFRVSPSFRGAGISSGVAKNWLAFSHATSL